VDTTVSSRPAPPAKDKEKGKEKGKDAAPKRGQKGKLKKMKEKYGEQDDEDRRLAAIALGHIKVEEAPPAPPEPVKDAAGAILSRDGVALPGSLGQRGGGKGPNCFFCGSKEHQVWDRHTHTDTHRHSRQHFTHTLHLLMHACTHARC
jgi:hypothetical protein